MHQIVIEVPWVTHELADAFRQTPQNTQDSSFVQESGLAESVEVRGKQQSGLGQIFRKSKGEVRNCKPHQILLEHGRSRAAGAQQSY